MSQVHFSYNGKNILIQCNSNDLIYYIFQNFATKINIDLNSLLFIYNGNNITNYNLTFYQLANLDDKKRNKINILVYDKIKYSSMTSNSSFFSTNSYPYSAAQVYQSNIIQQVIPAYQQNKILQVHPKNKPYPINQLNNSYQAIPSNQKIIAYQITPTIQAPQNYLNPQQINYTNTNKIQQINSGHPMNIPQNNLNYLNTNNLVANQNMNKIKNTQNQNYENLIVQKLMDYNNRINEIEKEIKEESKKLKKKN